MRSKYSPFKGPKKLSIAALSKQLPLQLMLCSTLRRMTHRSIWMRLLVTASVGMHDQACDVIGQRKHDLQQSGNRHEPPAFHALLDDLAVVPDYAGRQVALLAAYVKLGDVGYVRIARARDGRSASSPGITHVTPSFPSDADALVVNLVRHFISQRGRDPSVSVASFVLTIQERLQTYKRLYWSARCSHAIAVRAFYAPGPLRPQAGKPLNQTRRSGI